MHRHTQLVSNDMCLLIVDDGHGKTGVFLETLDNIGAALKGRRHKKLLHHDRIGHFPLFAFDETKRMLAICSTSGTVSYSSSKWRWCVLTICLESTPVVSVCF
jgi:hypothetical protein